MRSSKKASTLTTQLKAAVSDSHLTVNYIAAAAGIPQPVLYRFMTGKRDLKLSSAEKLAEYFGMRFTAPKKPKAP